MTLPNRKIRIEIPLMKYVMAVKNNPFGVRGLLPNHEIVPTINQRIAGEDPELEFARKLIRGN